MSYETVYDEDGTPETVYVKEEPDCHGCNDQGFVWVDAAGQPIGFDIDAVPVEQVNCEDCNPTAEQVAASLVRRAARQAEYERQVAAGEITFTDAPF